MVALTNCHQQVYKEEDVVEGLLMVVFIVVLWIVYAFNGSTLIYSSWKGSKTKKNNKKEKKRIYAP